MKRKAALAPQTRGISSRLVYQNGRVETQLPAWIDETARRMAPKIVDWVKAQTDFYDKITNAGLLKGTNTAGELEELWTHRLEGGRPGTRKQIIRGGALEQKLFKYFENVAFLKLTASRMISISSSDFIFIMGVAVIFLARPTRPSPPWSLPRWTA